VLIGFNDYDISMKGISLGKMAIQVWYIQLNKVNKS